MRFNVHRIRPHEMQNNPSGYDLIRENACLTETIKTVQDGIRKTENAYMVFDVESGKRYHLAELYEIRELAEKGN